MPLTDTAIKNAKPKDKPFKLADGGGMYLEVKPNGGKYWRWKYRMHGREKRLAIGVYPVITLAEARDKRLAAQQLLAKGVDPSAEKQSKREEAKLAYLNKRANTFEAVAREWHKHNYKGWTPRHADYVLRRLENDVFGEIGDRPIDELTIKDLVAVLKKIEARQARELARRTKFTFNQIFRYAAIHGKLPPNHQNPAAQFDNKDVLEPYAKGHFAMLDVKELPAFMAALEKNDARLYPHTRLAMKLLVLTFVRTNELIGARWSEFDLDNALWSLPAERMKMRRPHLVPLSRQVVEILQELNGYRQQWGTPEVPDFLFPNQSNPRRHMSDNTMLKAIERLGYKGKTTGHGFRALAMTAIKEKLGYRHEVVDRQLAHAPRNKVDAAYDRAQFLDERTVMMQRWADYVLDVKRLNK